MIDTDKYKGHNMHPTLLDVGEDYNNWDALQDMGFNDEARQLMADSPLLLAEVKRLRKHKKVLDKLYKMADADPDWKALIDDIWEMIE